MFQNCLAVGAGGFCGAILRYCGGLIPWLKIGSFPLPTLLINIIGAFLIGVIAQAAEVRGMNPSLLLFLKVGLCGGFTTFSTFSLESLTLLENGRTALFALYAAASLILCILGVMLGKAVIPA